MTIQLIPEDEHEGGPEGFFDEFTSDRYLGGCSYADEAAFRAGGYFDDMVSEAIDDLNAQIARADHFATCAHCKAVKETRGATFPRPVSA